MAFGDYFTYNGIPCTEFGLRLYEVNGVSPGNGSFSMPSASEDRVAGRQKSFFYGTTQNEPLKFKLVFGLDRETANAGGYIDRWDREAIAAWLSPLDGYQWLEIEQPDMEGVRYRCRITSLTMIELANVPVAFSCEVCCDSPFAYLYPLTYRYSSAGRTDAVLRNLGSYAGGYYPRLRIETKGSSTIQIINHTDGGRVFEFQNLPGSNSLVIDVDNENGIITNNMDLNLYPNFNFEFFKLVCGDNRLEIVGDCTVDVICEFPVNIGG